MSLEKEGPRPDQGNAALQAEPLYSRTQPPRSQVTREHALAYARQGWHVFPVHSAWNGTCTCGRTDCPSPAKHPRTRHGLKDATRDEAVIRTFFPDGQDCNIGAVCGVLNGIVVIDIDPKNDGENGIAGLERALGPLPATLTSMTPSGGRHLYFACPPTTLIRNATRFHGAPGVDIRGDGGYVVVPPSVGANGRAYTWLPTETALATLPAPWLGLIERRETQREADTREQPSGPQARPLSAATVDFETQGAEPGERNTRLFHAACDYCAAGHPIEVARSALVPVALRIGLRDPEARATIQSAYSKPRSSSKADSQLRQADQLVALARSQYRFGLSLSGDPFAVERNGPHIAMLLGGSCAELKSHLASAYWDLKQSAPSSSAMGDATNVLIGLARREAPEQIWIRVASLDGNVIIDVGDNNGAVVNATADGWSIRERSPVLFLRSPLLHPLPRPRQGGRLELLRNLINTSNEGFELFLGWLLASFFPTIARPILLFSGGQGDGKSTAARIATSFVDPSPAPLRTQPRDPDQWAVMAAASYAIVIDNVSWIPDWLSDSLCRAVTGDGWVKRRLYTDSELSVLAFRRVIALTSIDPGNLRGDLGDRLLLVDLEPIDEMRRRTETELIGAATEHGPLIFGAILDLLCSVLRELPNVVIPSSPRLADFARVLAAMDRVLGTASLGAYLGQRDRIAQDILEGDQVATAIMKWSSWGRSWSGTMQSLLLEIQPERPEKNWPSTPRGLSGRLRRLIPFLMKIGVVVVPPAANDKKRVWVIRASPEPPRPPDAPTN